MSTQIRILEAAFAAHQAGRLTEAEQMYRDVIEAEPRNGAAWHLLGLAAHQARRFSEAVRLLEEAISCDSSKAAWHNHLAAAYLELADNERAAASLDRAIDLDPANGFVHYNLAILRQRQGDKVGALESFRRTVAIRPDMAEAQLGLGKLLAQQGNLAEAEKCLVAAWGGKNDRLAALLQLAQVQRMGGNVEQAELHLQIAVSAHPQHFESHLLLGNLLLALGKYADALSVLQRAVALEPRNPEALNNLGAVWRELGENHQAERCFREALELAPDSVLVLGNLAALQFELRDYEIAETTFRRVLELDANSTLAYLSLGRICHKQRRFADAIDWFRQTPDFENNAQALADLASTMHAQGDSLAASELSRRALALEPANTTAWAHLATCLHALGKSEEALSVLDQAVALQDTPELHCVRAEMLLSLGNLLNGFRDFEYRLHIADPLRQKPSGPVWDGSPLAGRTLLVHSEQGLGDTLQFVRYVRLVEKMGGPVVLQAQRALVPLLLASGYPNVIGVGTPPPRYDVQFPLLSLPHLLGTTIDTVPAEVPYITAAAERIDAWRAKLQSIDGFKVGIAWQGNPEFTVDHQRSIPLAQFTPLADVPGVRLLSLQRMVGLDQLPPLEERLRIVDLLRDADNEHGPFMDTAAALGQLDLVITSDTAIAHLAGAMGVPVWVALSSNPDWRWLRGRSDMPWYPTMRLFRQRQLFQWEEVFQQMAQRLQSIVAGTSNPAG